MKVLIIDNYDSFTFNLYQYAGELLDEKGDAFRLDVERNDAVTVKEIASRNYDRIIISPGPGDPTDRAYFGICSDVLLDLAKELPVLGVCLGMQGMAAVYGGKVKRAKLPMHGKTSLIRHDAQGVFVGLPDNLSVMRYHSLIVERSSLPDCFEETSVSQDTDELMGIRHREYRRLEGIQFHPESFATEGGIEMLRNFLFLG